MVSIPLALVMAMTSGSPVAASPAASPAAVELADGSSWHLVPHHLSLDIEGEAAATTDGIGMDLRVGGCMGLGPFCVGPALQYQQTTADASSSRLGTDLLLVTELPLRVGRVLVTPSLGVGAGWLHTYHVTTQQQAISNLACAGPVPGGPVSTNNCQFSDLSVEPPSQETFGARVDAGLKVGIPIRENWSLTGHLGVTLAPFAHTAPLVGAPLSPNQALLAGEPLLIARLGFGAQWATP